jgi:hypothetical protein
MGSVERRKAGTEIKLRATQGIGELSVELEKAERVRTDRWEADEGRIPRIITSFSCASLKCRGSRWRRSAPSNRSSRAVGFSHRPPIVGLLCRLLPLGDSSPQIFVAHGVGRSQLIRLVGKEKDAGFAMGNLAP